MRGESVLPAGHLEEVRVGPVALIGSTGIRSGFEKTSYDEPRWLGPLGLTGDAQAETFHGGSDRAILQYDSDHYALWRQEYPELADRFVPGGFGENFVVAGMNEQNMCLGDVVRAGEAVLQVAESRQPCFKLNHRFGRPDMAALTQRTRRTGWLYRVLQPGHVAVGDRVEVVDRPLPHWPISRLQHFLYEQTSDAETAATLSELPELSAAFRGLFARRVATSATEDWSERLSNGAIEVRDRVWHELVVAETEELTPSVRRFVLRHRDGSPVRQYDAGAHIDLQVRNELTRSYSLCTLPSPGGYEIAVQREESGRGASRHLHDEVRPGDLIMGTDPENFFPLQPADRYVFIAGGIGITPFLTMIEQAETAGTPWELHHSVRDPRDVPCTRSLLERFPDRVRLYVTQGDPGRRVDLDALLAEPAEGTQVYCCGSARLMGAVRESTARWPAGAVRFEAFAPDGDRDDGLPFTAVLAVSGGAVEVPRGRSLLEALRRAGVAVSSSCEAGTCGTCMLSYRSGTVDHRDVVLAPDERADTIVSCVSRAVGEIVLDI